MTRHYAPCCASRLWAPGIPIPALAAIAPPVTDSLAMNDILRPGAQDALEAWAGRVRANSDQAERFREGPPPGDFYAPVASAFRADPFRTDEEALNVLKSLVVPGETWLDIGAGGGRYALPLAAAGARVVAIEPSEGMLDVLRAGMADYNTLTDVERFLEALPGLG